MMAQWQDIGRWMMAHPKLSVFLGLLSCLVLFLTFVAMKTPRHDRDWADDVARLPEVRREASTMIVFEFADHQLLGLSVEARKEAGEPYGLVHGTLNGFELIYVWASPRDMFTRRVLVQEHEIYMYPLALTQGEAEAYLNALLEKTEAIEQRPRFYNTFTSNCTNELAKTAGLNWHPAFIFTGNSARALFDQDRISGHGSYDELNTRANMTETIRRLSGASDETFNAGLLDSLAGP